MDAGPELDARVAETIEPKPSPFDLLDADLLARVIAGEAPRSPKGAWVVATSGYDGGDNLFWAPLPYSASIEATWQVVEHLTAGDEGWMFKLTTHADGWQASFGIQDPSTATTAPLAICRAALAVKG